VQPENEKAAKPVLFTLGHGALEAERFVAILNRVGIGLLVDVRSAPGSRRSPHFGRAELERWLPAAGVAYRWEPELGGFRKPKPDSLNGALRHPSFRGYADWMASERFLGALDRLIAEAALEPTAVMCAEALWWRCHRRLISDAAVLLAKVQVRHIGHDGRLSDHRITSGALLAEGPARQILIYPPEPSPLQHLAFEYTLSG
jgi:uncharacterized protein (DUF488 family)